MMERMKSLSYKEIENKLEIIISESWMFGGAQLLPVESVCDLGVFFYSFLSFVKHVNFLEKTVFIIFVICICKKVLEQA